MDFRSTFYFCYFYILHDFNKFCFTKKLSDWGLYRQVFEQKRMKQIQESLRGIINNKIFNLNIKLSELFNRFTEKKYYLCILCKYFQ